MAGWPKDKNRDPEERTLVERCRSLGCEEAEAELAAMGVSTDCEALAGAIRAAAAVHREPFRLSIESLTEEELDRELASLGVDPSAAERSFAAVQAALSTYREPLRLRLESLSDEELDRELESFGVDPSAADRSFAAVQAALSVLRGSERDRARSMNPDAAEDELRRFGLGPDELQKSFERLRWAVEIARAEAEAADLATALWAEVAAAPPPESEFAQLGRRLLEVSSRLTAEPAGQRILEVRNQAQDLAAELARPKPRPRRLRTLADRLADRLSVEQGAEGPGPTSALGEILEDLSLAVWRVQTLVAETHSGGRFAALFAFHKLSTEAEEDDREEDLEAMSEDARRLADLERSRETGEEPPRG
ncbi:MAG: hypothetical protein ACK41F_07195 [Fimbriimonadaceae bacterium]